MDFRNIKSLFIGGKPVSKLLVGGRLVWQKAKPVPPEPVVEGAYIETDGQSYMDLGFAPTENTTYEICAMFVSGSYTGTSVLRNCVYGANGRTSTVSAHSLYYSSSASALRFVKPTCNEFTELSPGDKLDITYDGSGISVNGRRVPIEPRYSSAVTMKFGTGYVEGGSAYFSVSRFYSARFWESGVLIRDLVPYSGPRGVGLLDKVHDVLYTNAGGGTLTYGVDWTNPYITDGLLGMWDAEWNEAGGVHNPELMQLNDLTGNLFPMPVAVLGDKWFSRSENPSFSYADHPSLALLINSEGHREHTVEGYSSFDPSLASISGTKYAFVSLLNLKNASTNATGTVQFGYGLDGGGRCVNLRGFVAGIISDVDGADGVGRTFSSSTLNEPGGLSIGYLDGVEYGRYEWSSGSVYSYVSKFAFGATGNYWDKIKTSCLRIYNRVLTPEEVAHNARVDRERFGLT